jgi:hypothetical protein
VNVESLVSGRIILVTVEHSVPHLGEQERRTTDRTHAQQIVSLQKVKHLMCARKRVWVLQRAVLRPHTQSASRAFPTHNSLAIGGG